jgi:hypothetical protein
VYFFVKTKNPRPTFHVDMTPDERALMSKHVEYWSDVAARGAAIVFGPVMDPQGVYGIGVYNVEDEAAMRTLLAHDPANGLLEYDLFSMPRVVLGSPRSGDRESV